jgi:hypothetical protein
MVDKPLGFVALNSIKQGPASAKASAGEPRDVNAILSAIRTIYFKTSKRTIEGDMAHAIELLKSLPSEDERDKAAVYMEGLAQMRSEWGVADQRKKKKKKAPR